MAVRLQIGIENELYLQPLNEDHITEDRLVLPKTLVDFYNAYIEPDDIPLKVGDNNNGRPASKKQIHDSEQFWIVAEDYSLGEASEYEVGGKVQGIPVELIAPILPYDAEHNWRMLVANHWELVRLFGTVDINKACSTHVHVSPKGTQGWCLPMVKAVARAALYFENALELLAPFSRRRNEYCKANKVDNWKLKDLTLDGCFARISGCTTVVQIASLMQPPRVITNEGKDIKPADGEVDRYYAWNFDNLRPKGIGTIEFRKAPGVKTAEACCAWHLRSYDSNVEGLKRFIKDANIPGVNRFDLVEPIFDNLTGYMVPTPVGPVIPMDKALKVKKWNDEKRQKNYVMQQLRQVTL